MACPTRRHLRLFPPLYPLKVLHPGQEIKVIPMCTTVVLDKQCPDLLKQGLCPRLPGPLMSLSRSPHSTRSRHTGDTGSGFLDLVPPRLPSSVLQVLHLQLVLQERKIPLRVPNYFLILSLMINRAAPRRPSIVPLFPLHCKCAQHLHT